jgi:hypothetical protein
MVAHQNLRGETTIGIPVIIHEVAAPLDLREHGLPEDENSSA